MIIAYVADENYKDYLQASIKSFLKYNPKAHIVVVSERPMPCGHENILIPLYKKFRNRGIGDRISNTAYLKLYLTKLPYDKILYVDCDTICQAPLSELWDMKCDYINLTESHSYGKKQAEAIGAEKYGLTGMMVMNLKNLRKIDFTNKCLDVEMNYPTPSTGWQHDETCINVAMKDYINFIDKKWNYCHNRTYDLPIKESNAKILHYVGKDKAQMLTLPFYYNLPEVLNYLKGKKVAIVGNAKSIFDYSAGEEINKHDAIIRFNKGFVIDEESQGKRTSILILGCEINKIQIDSYNARFTINRSGHYRNAVQFVISQTDRELLKEKIGSQPSTGFMAIDLCLTAGTKHIDLYGFDWERTPTFYNPQGYETQHNYKTEESIVRSYESAGLLTVKKGSRKCKTINQL